MNMGSSEQEKKKNPEIIRRKQGNVQLYTKTTMIPKYMQCWSRFLYWSSRPLGIAELQDRNM